MQGLRLEAITKSFGATQAAAGVSFTVDRGEIFALLGPSGCGKSTLLALIAGLIPPDQGAIYWENQPLNDLPTHRRGFGLMFQDYLLFPHLDVAANVAFGLKMQGLGAETVADRVRQTLDLVGLHGYEKRDVISLSGGEQQRVALARSLAPGPRLLMLDEPLGALDRALRERLVQDVQEILRRTQQTAIYVTHDQEEAYLIADRLAVMNAGRIEQVGAPQEIYRAPLSLFVARFLGLTNLLPARLRAAAEGSLIETPLGDWPWREGPPGPATVLLRPDAVHLGPGAPCQLSGRVVQSAFRGGLSRLEIEVNAHSLSFDFPSRLSLPAAGDLLTLHFDPAEALQVFRE
ncbi:MAG: ABC transporter ATP-binding protein [Chloroflexi bacterium]|nr:ABC transporter ATP-binding protein [Chloroflexota bacterium]